MEDVAQRVVTRLFEDLVDGQGEPACALIRLYVTARHTDLEEHLRGLALAAAPDVVADTRCLTLLASSGVDPAWNDRRSSQRHQVLPLFDEALVERLPMVAALLKGMGIDLASVVRPDPTEHATRSGRRYDLFFVPEAAGSASVPDGEFVERFGIRSTVGFGGVLPSGELFAVVLFARVTLTREVAELLRSLALTVQALLVPHTYRLFERPARA